MIFLSGYLILYKLANQFFFFPRLSSLAREQQAAYTSIWQFLFEKEQFYLAMAAVSLVISLVLVVRFGIKNIESFTAKKRFIIICSVLWLMGLDGFFALACLAAYCVQLWDEFQKSRTASA